MTENNKSNNGNIPPETLPEEVIKKLEEKGILSPSKRPRVPSGPYPSITSHKAQKPSPPPPPSSKTEGIKSQIKPLIPNLRKLFKFMAGSNILPQSVSFEKVKIGREGVLYLGKNNIGKMFENLDAGGASVRIYLSRLGLQGDIPEVIKSRFPVSDAIVAINRDKEKFFIVTEKRIALGFGKTTEDKPIFYVYGTI